jgi:hypothetical protein
MIIITIVFTHDYFDRKMSKNTIIKTIMNISNKNSNGRDNDDDLIIHNHKILERLGL